MRAKEMIDDLLKRGKIEPNEHMAIQLQMAGEKLEILPDDDEVSEWFDLWIGEGCSASSGIYKFRNWLKERMQKHCS